MPLSKQEKQVLWEMAERAVTIPPGEKQGRWSREERVVLVYSALCSMVRISERNNNAKLSTG
jgi:hypothetical protein